MIVAKDETLEPVKPVRTDDRDLFVKINTFECYLGRITPEACKLQRERKAPDGTIDPPIPCRTCTDWEEKAQEVYKKRLEYLNKLSSKGSETALSDNTLNTELFSRKFEEVNSVLKDINIRLKAIESKITDIFEDSEGGSPLAEVFQVYLSVAIEEVVSELSNRLFEFQKEILFTVDKVKKELLEKIETLISRSATRTEKRKILSATRKAEQSLRREKPVPTAKVEKQETSPVAEKIKQSSKEEKLASTVKVEKQEASSVAEKAKSFSESEKTTPGEEKKESVLKVTSRTGKTVYKFAKCISCGKEGKIMARGLCIRCYFTRRQKESQKKKRSVHSTQTS